MNKKYYSVMEVAEIIGVSKQTIVRYEKNGVFPKPNRNKVNKWREYTKAEIEKMKEILGRI